MHYHSQLCWSYDLMKVTPNTLKAHRLTSLAGKDGKATEMVERILRAYFTEGQDIGDVETLANLAAEVGIDAQKAKAFLLSDEGIEEVKELEQQAICASLYSLRYRSKYPQCTHHPHRQGNTSRRSIG
jgi:predicted DsbA family dithiol-disulfide isomerase